MAEIVGKYIVEVPAEWTSDMVPLIAADYQGIAEWFAKWWTWENFRIFKTASKAGVYDAKTGKLLVGYVNGERIRHLKVD